MGPHISKLEPFLDSSIDVLLTTLSFLSISINLRSARDKVGGVDNETRYEDRFVVMQFALKYVF